MNKGVLALGRLRVGVMNKTEARYSDYLRARVNDGTVAWFKFEALKLRLADNTFYTPDFAVMLASGQMQCHEIKGYWQDDARVKIKVAADLYPFQFFGVTAKPMKAGGGWSFEEF